MKDLYIRPENVKFLKEMVGEIFHDIGLGNNFMDMSTKAQAIKIKIKKWKYIKLKNFCMAKATISRVKWNERKYLGTYG